MIASCKYLSYEYDSILDPLSGKEAATFAFLYAAITQPSCGNSSKIQTDGNLRTFEIENKSPKSKTPYFRFSTQSDYYYNITWQDKDDDESKYSANIKVTAYDKDCKENSSFTSIEDGSNAINLLGNGDNIYFKVEAIDSYGSYTLKVNENIVENVFVSTGSMSNARAFHTASLNNDGNVIVIAGLSGSDSYLNSVELYDTDAGTFSNLNSLAISIVGHSSALLTSGDLLITGGEDASSYYSDTHYVTSSSTSAQKDMLSTRIHHTTTLLGTGDVLIAGGKNNSVLNTGELYINQASVGNTMSSPRYWHTATLLDNGKVLLAGGIDGSASTLSSADLYDTTFSATGSMTAARAYHTATKLSNGKVLIAGGRNTATLSSAELYDPDAGTFSSTGSMTTARAYHTATLLDNGKVLIAGGLDSSDLQSTELYDPDTGTFSAASNMSVARGNHQAIKLNNGRVLITGGRNGSTYHNSAEIYYP